MSSHREAPEMCKDPAADSTDLYAFVSPDKPDTVTLIANYVPLQQPSGGPNFFEFGDDVLYEIHIDNDGDGRADISYKFRFKTEIRSAERSCTTSGRSSRSTAPTGTGVSSSRCGGPQKGGEKALANNLPCPPCNIGPLSTPNYAATAASAIHDLPGGRRVFAGQRAEALLRRPRRGVRPGRPAALPAAARALRAQRSGAHPPRPASTRRRRSTSTRSRSRFPRVSSPGTAPTRPTRRAPSR